MILGVHVTRQLWIQLRLLALMALPPIAAIVAIAVNSLGSGMGRTALAIGFAVAAVLSGALVGTGFSAEVRSGAAAWLVVRAVPRTGLIGAWLIVPSLAILLAYVLGGILAGLAIPQPTAPSQDPVAVVVSVVAAAAPAIPLAAAALAIAVDASGARTAALVLAGAVVVAVPVLLIGQGAVHPASGYWVVAGMAPGDRPLTAGLQAIGLCLALAALAWYAASRRFLRSDL